MEANDARKLIDEGLSRLDEKGYQGDVAYISPATANSIRNVRSILDPVLLAYNSLADFAYGLNVLVSPDVKDDEVVVGCREWAVLDDNARQVVKLAETL